MDYLIIVLLLVGGSLAAGWALSRTGFAVPAEAEQRMVLLLTFLFFLAYAALGLYKFDAMQMGAWDFGIYDSMLHNAATGKGLMLDYRGSFDHFSPIMMLFVPLYWLWDSPAWLVLIQSAALAAAAPLLYRAAKRSFPQGGFPLLLTAMYLFNPYYSRLALYDFHAECLFPLFLFAAFVFYQCRRFGWFFLILALTPLIKEDFVIPLGAAGLWLLTQRGRRKWGIAAIGMALFWTFFVLKIYYPYILRVEYWHYGRYELFAPSVAETIGNITQMIGQVLSRNTLGVALSLLIPFAFLPAVNWRMALFFWLPTLGIQLISANYHQQLLFSHYGAAMLAVTPITALYGARVLRYLLHKKEFTPPQKRGALAFAAILMLGNHMLLCDLPLARFENYTDRTELHYAGGFLSLPFRPAYWQEMERRKQHAAKFREIAERFPIREETTIISQNELAGHFYRTATVYDIPELGLGTSRPARADYFFLDGGNYIGNCDFEGVSYMLNELLEDPEYQLFRYPDGILVFARKNMLPPAEDEPATGGIPQ